MHQLQFILFFTTLFLSILQTPSELKIAKLSWMLLCVHAKLCSKNVFGAIYLYVPCIYMYIILRNEKECKGLL